MARINGDGGNNLEIGTPTADEGSGQPAIQFLLDQGRLLKQPYHLGQTTSSNRSCRTGRVSHRGPPRCRHPSDPIQR